MKVAQIMENNVINASDRFTTRRTRDNRKTGHMDSVIADIEEYLKPRWNQKFYHDILDVSEYNKDEDYLTRLYWNLPTPGEPMESENRIAHTLVMNNKQLILNTLETEREHLGKLMAKYGGLLIFANIVHEYITINDLLLQGFKDYFNSY